MTLKPMLATLLMAFATTIIQDMAVAQPVGLPNIASVDESDLPVGIERKIGQIVMNRSYGQVNYIDDSDIRDYFNQMADRLIINSKLTIPTPDVFALKDPQINAFAMVGGYIGVHTGLMSNATTESEVASVLAHEIAHVSQRHIARGVGQAKNDTLMLIATAVAAAVASQAAGGQGAQAALMVGQAISVDTKLGYSRAAEQEADRLGLELLVAGGYDPQGMVDFFNTLHKTSQLNRPITGSFATTHPLSLDRMTDMQLRVQQLNHQPIESTIDFYMIQGLMRVYQAQGLKEQTDLATFFEQQIISAPAGSSIKIAGLYGLGVLYLQRQQLDLAQQHVDKLNALRVNHPLLSRLAIETALAKNNVNQALSLAEQAFKQYPERRSISYLYAKALEQQGAYAQAIAHARSHLKLWSTDRQMYFLMAQAYAATGNSVAEKKALAEYSTLQGAYDSAILQLRQARQLSNDFYEQSVIDVRLQEIIEQKKEEDNLIKKFS